MLLHVGMQTFSVSVPELIHGAVIGATENSSSHSLTYLLTMVKNLIRGNIFVGKLVCP